MKPVPVRGCGLQRLNMTLDMRTLAFFKANVHGAAGPGWRMQQRQGLTWRPLRQSMQPQASC